MAKRSAACEFGDAPALGVGRERVLDAIDAPVERLLRGLDDGHGEAAVEKRQRDAGAHGAGAEDADGLDVAQLGVGADARQVGGLALGEEGVLQRAGVGARCRLAEHLPLACLTFADGQGRCRLDGIDGGLRRDRPARVAGDGSAGLLEQAGGNGRLVDLLVADAARRFAHLLLGKGDSRGDHVAVRDLVDETCGGALGGVDERAGGDELQGLLDADGPRQPLRAAGTRDDAELDLGQSQLTHVLGGDAVMAAERQFQPAAQRRAVDGRHHRLGRGLDAVDQLRQVGLLHLGLEFRDVGPGREEPARPRQDDGFHARVGVGLVEGLLQAYAQGMAQRVDRWVVHLDDGDIALLLRLDYGHDFTPYLPRQVPAPCLARTYARGYSLRTKHSREIRPCCAA